MLIRRLGPNYFSCSYEEADDDNDNNNDNDKEEEKFFTKCYNIQESK